MSICRTFSQTKCLSAGAVVNGKVNAETYVALKCAERVTSKKWFNVKIVIEEIENLDRAVIYVNDKLLTDTLKMKHSKNVGGGVIVLNIYNNILNFKNLQTLSKAGIATQ